jgi:hypothetical protein
MNQINVVAQSREPWNEGKLVGQKAPLKPTFAQRAENLLEAAGRVFSVIGTWRNAWTPNQGSAN